MKKVIIALVSLLVTLPAIAPSAHASVGSDVIETGEKYLGTPYEYGAPYGDTSSFDCSSFTKWVFSRNGIDLDRVTRDQVEQGTPVSRSDLKVGDLLFYDTDHDEVINHVGIYAGDGKMLNAQASGGVKYADAFSPYYWESRYVSARRVIPEQTTKSSESEPQSEEETFSHSTTAARMGGANRFEVATKIARDGWDQSDTVFLTNHSAFADALSAAPLAYKQDAPILLTLSDKLGTETKKELDRLNPSNVVLVGGTGSIKESVINEIKSINSNIEVKRIGGEDRFAVSYNIANQLGSADKAIVANGLKYPDALSIAPYAARHGYPILLTESNELPDATDKALDKVSESIVVGGSASVGSEVYSQLPDPMRIGGKNRFEVAANVLTQLNQSTEQAYVTTGLDFADALTGSVLAAKEESPMLLTFPDHFPDSTRKVIESENIPAFKVLGGTSSVNEELYNQLNNNE